MTCCDIPETATMIPATSDIVSGALPVNAGPVSVDSLVTTAAPGHNPTKAKIPVPPRKVWKGQDTETRKICENEQWVKWESIANKIEAIQEHYHEQLQEVGAKYGLSFKTVVNYVLYSSWYKKQHAPSLYLVKVSAKAEEVNKNKAIGDRVHLDDICRMIKDEEDVPEYEGMMKEEESALLDHLLEK
ncbi:hypothetical protein EDD18DRAFT_1114818 [Armillaria luteobubalina]|uniref:Uncharacterized protein n=1 Tax=Armillaria luteobubalina TaxID=153913 RepID=A0AA39P416_9AGAR|nr:hypothetical protein EDD18DRAFT_1114818 [Armillaria luteobubalina]